MTLSLVKRKRKQSGGCVLDDGTMIVVEKKVRGLSVKIRCWFTSVHFQTSAGRMIFGKKACRGGRQDRG